MKARCRKFAQVALTLLLLCNVARADDAALLVVELAEADAEATERLGELSERPREVVRAEACDPSCGAALGLERAAREVVIFDTAHANVQVVRSLDGRVWTRTSDPATTTPLRLAFVAVELLALSEDAESPAVQGRVDVRHDEALRVRWLAIRTGFAGPLTEPYRGSVRPDLGVLAAAGRPDSPWSLWVEAAVAPGLRAARTVELGHFSVRRTNLVSRVGALFDHARLGLAGWGQIGAGIVRARWDGEHARVDRGAGLVLGAGLEPNVRLSDWARLYLSTQVAGAAQRKEYRAEGRRLLREPALTVEVGLGLWFTLPVR